MESKIGKHALIAPALYLFILFLTSCASINGDEPSFANVAEADVSTATPTVIKTEPAPGSNTTQEAAEMQESTTETNISVDETTDSDHAAATTEPTAVPTIENTPTATPQPPTATPEKLVEDGVFLQDDRPEHLRLSTEGWNTNWARHTVDYADFLSGGPPRDGIPSISNPEFVSIEDASVWLAGNEPVIALEIEGEARAYPLQILIWHEIVNDTLGEVPVVITFCPLCNSAIVFDRRLDGETHEFGTSGLLRNSDLVMYDRTTESLWQQFTGDAIVGDLVGEQLIFQSSSLVSFADFRDAFAEGVVLSKDTGFVRPYGINPYAGYDTYDNPLSQGGNIALLKQEQDRRLPAAERVVTVSLPDSSIDVAYPLSILSENSVIHDQQGEQEIVIFFKPGTSSALGTNLIAIAEDVGATGVFDPNLDGQKLTFSMIDGEIKDDQTATTWNIFGQATAGELTGHTLSPIIHGDHFWFSWAAFKPETIIYEN